MKAFIESHFFVLLLLTVLVTILVVLNVTNNNKEQSFQQSILSLPSSIYNTIALGNSNTNNGGGGNAVTLHSLRKLEEKKKGQFHHKMYGTNVTFDHHKKSYMVLEEVNGLKNEHVAVFVTSTNNFEGAFLRERIIPSARTWMRFFAHVFVVVEDTFDIRFSLRNCEILDTPHYTSFTCHNEATYILSRTCTNEYYGANGPCCKVDDAFNYLLNDRAELAATIKYALHCDDDTYWRPDQVLKWLGALDKSGVSGLPLIGNLDSHRDEDHGIWHIGGCQEIQSNGWYQPLMLNAAALQLIKTSVANHGIQDTCRGFDVTHDVGMGVYAWLFGLYHVQIPHLERNDQHKGVSIFNGQQMVVHYIKPHDQDGCRDATKWPEKDRYNQKEAIGCGDIGTPGPLHNGGSLQADMYDAQDFFRQHGEDLEVDDGWVDQQVTLHPSSTVKGALQGIKAVLKGGDQVDKDGKFHGDEVVTKKIPRLHQLTGYKNTPHGKKNDLVKSWVGFSVKDCDPPGKINA